jgi:hypothetical protein
MVSSLATTGFPSGHDWQVAVGHKSPEAQGMTLIPQMPTNQENDCQIRGGQNVVDVEKREEAREGPVARGRALAARLQVAEYWVHSCPLPMLPMQPMQVMTARTSPDLLQYGPLFISLCSLLHCQSKAVCSSISSVI